MKKKLFLGFLILLVLSGIYIWQNYEGSKKLTSAQKEESIKTMLGRNIKVEKVTSDSLNHYQGKYFSFFYPADGTIYKVPGSLSKSTLETFSFDTLDPKMTFSAQASTLVAQDDVPGLTFRRNKKELYQESSAEINSTTAIIFTKKTDGGEKSAFIKTSKYIYSFSATAPLF